MSILWAGGEDLSFPNAPAGTVNVVSSNYRSGYARCGVQGNTAAPARSNNFPGGAVTSCWLTWRMGPSSLANYQVLGLCKDSSSAAGIYVGVSSASQLALYKYDGTTKTQLAAESGNSLTSSGSPHRIDLQLVNYGSSATINVYIDFVLVISYSGNPTVAGVTSLSAVGLGGYNGGLTNFTCSEIIVADEDTRPMIGLNTLALTGAGTTAAWTNSTYTNINATTISDSNPASSNTDSQAQDYNVTDLPSGTFAIKAVMIAARMAKSATPAVNQVKLGYNNGSGTSGAGAGATKALTTSYATYEQLDTQNPITSSDWAQSDINALQVELTAKT